MSHLPSSPPPRTYTFIAKSATIVPINHTLFVSKINTITFALKGYEKRIPQKSIYVKPTSIGHEEISDTDYISMLRT